MKHDAINLSDQEDKFKWSKNKGSGIYTAKLGYATRMKEDDDGEKKWWWKNNWKLNFPLKTKTFLWLALSNKILTWDNGQKRNWHGPPRCILCKNNEETVDHLFVHSSYSRDVWIEALCQRGRMYVKGNLLELF